MCEYNFAFNLFSPLFPSLACSPAKIPTAVDRLSLFLPLSSPALCLVLLFPFSLALLLRVSLRFFRSEPSSPPLTSVYEARPPPTSLLYPHLPPLPPRTFTTPPPQPLHTASLPSIPFVLNTPLLFLLSPFTFSFDSLSLSLFLFFLCLDLFTRAPPFSLALFDCRHLAPCRSLAVVIIKHCENQRQ